MAFSTPSWWAERGIISTLLMPVSWIYHFASRMVRANEPAHAAAVPIICIGNVVAGGAGKTPVAIAIARMLSAQGKNVYFLSRGYGGNRSDACLVDVNIHTHREVGDEPLLLAAEFPTVVSRSRPEGAALAASLGAEVIVMDDGFQNGSLKKTLSLLVIDAQYGTGNGRLFPAGPLREPLDEALRRADAVVIIHPGASSKHAVGFTIQKPIVNAFTVPADPDAFYGKKVIAFAGIARPEKFFNMLKQIGSVVIAQHPFADHHSYTMQELDHLLAEATASGATLVSTHKDWVRLPAMYKSRVAVLDITVDFEDIHAVTALLRIV